MRNEESQGVYILRLEQLRHGKEGLGGLGGGNDLTLVHKIEDLGEDRNALLRLDLGLMEDPGLLEHSTLVDIGKLVGICSHKGKMGNERK